MGRCRRIKVYADGYYEFDEVEGNRYPWDPILTLEICMNNDEVTLYVRNGDGRVLHHIVLSEGCLEQAKSLSQRSGPDDVRRGIEDLVRICGGVGKADLAAVLLSACYILDNKSIISHLLGGEDVCTS